MPWFTRSQCSKAATAKACRFRAPSREYLPRISSPAETVVARLRKHPATCASSSSPSSMPNAEAAWALPRALTAAGTHMGSSAAC
eukprot:scaffold4055_cov132-Isochrysis_galbana.AAC.2